MRRRGKAIALTAVVLGLAVLIGAGIAAKDRIAEEWWIYKLRTGDEEEKEVAAESLGEMRSVRAVHVLVEGLGQERTEPIVEAPEGAATEAGILEEEPPAGELEQRHAS